ncbi:quinon protein alcohol dehydrogenase-like superfamily [Suillus paluster]|uniref:quinon protein alcohol dehydrogenase-like superfamily n=1 Tax=Suillus paluster TaxID=48578 RepID=UPI001B879B13|nr:quinon protein alcohol dehydrogenase-like superfamily [Suillus paluster]KAG1745407.1 quinon protein alcohol dehydrogenase-like superfamily [Suillus paluster]
MSSRAPAKQGRSAMKPHRKMQGHTKTVTGVVRLPGQRRIITCSWDGSLRVWDLESGMQVGEPWKDEGSGPVLCMALSPDGKTIACGTLSHDGIMTMGLIWWDTKTGKVIKKWTGHTDDPNCVKCICWSPDGGQVVIGGWDNFSFRVWDVKSGHIILAPIDSEEGWDHRTDAISYSPDGTMIVTGTADLLKISPEDRTLTIMTGLGERLKIWDANTGELLKTIKGRTAFLAWSLDGKTLFAGSYGSIRKFDTATWTETVVVDRQYIGAISLSPNERILACTHLTEKTVQLWNLETNQPIGLPLHLEYIVHYAAFSADGKFLATGGPAKNVYIWDVSAIVKEAGLDHLLSGNVNTIKKLFKVDVTRPQARQRPAPRIEGTRRPPPGFFDDPSTSRGRRTTAQPQRTLLNHLPSFWRRYSNPRGDTERDIRLRNIPVVDVPCAPGKPRIYHTRGQSSSRPPNPQYLHRNASKPTIIVAATTYRRYDIHDWHRGRSVYNFASSSHHHSYWMARSFDVLVASAQLGQPEVDLGPIPGGGGLNSAVPYVFHVAATDAACTEDIHKP